MPEFYMIFAPKNNKSSEFYVIFARKCPNFHDISPNICSRNLGGGGTFLLPVPPARSRLLRLWYVTSRSVSM